MLPALRRLPTAHALIADGSLDISAMLRALQQFFAEHSERWLGHDRQKRSRADRTFST